MGQVEYLEALDEIATLKDALAAEKESTKRVLMVLDDVYKREFALIQEVEELKDDIERYRLRESLRDMGIDERTRDGF